MPYKHNELRRHKFNKTKYKVTNWKEYTQSLRHHGDTTIWILVDAIDNWHSKKISGKNGRAKEY